MLLLDWNGKLVLPHLYRGTEMGTSLLQNLLLLLGLLVNAVPTMVLNQWVWSKMRLIVIMETSQAPHELPVMV